MSFICVVYSDVCGLIAFIGFPICLDVAYIVCMFYDLFYLGLLRVDLCFWGLIVCFLVGLINLISDAAKAVCCGLGLFGLFCFVDCFVGLLFVPSVACLWLMLL